MESVGVQLFAEELDIGLGGGLNSAELGAGLELPADVGLAVSDCGAGVEGRDLHLARLGVGLQNTLVGDDLHRASAGHSPLLAGLAEGAGAGARDEVDLVGESPLVELHHDERALGEDGDLAGAAGAGEAHLGGGVAADDCRVEVAVLVNLRAAQKAHLDLAVLEEVLEHLAHARDHERASHERRIADGRGHAVRNGTHGAGLVDHAEVGGVGRPGEVAGEVGEPDADEHHRSVGQLARRLHGHELARRVVGGEILASSHS